ncbi:DUF3302 domain-containing protein [Hoeflea poritis]|uniref:DUF3302 domain-containing protein n=1 Tax=Hoeflea poritis TaxID=2993659 RepID=A0ABT4VLR8_9HYPH|nr:DUF3302 domain-containing protein [Hoeflea poritis]MDA4845652.1 DUF3302 domain-containing protein [Hoeflea poritis]
MHLIDFPVTGYDYLTFLFLIVLIVVFFYVIIQLGSLPGKIAERRNHPHAEAVKIVGWIGLFTVFPWIHAIIWALHEATLVDVRSMPDSNTDLEGQRATVYGVPLPGGPTKQVDVAEIHAAPPADGDANPPETAGTSEKDDTEKPA